MNPENTKILHERYPRLYRRKDLPMSQTCMCWGFSCGDGWFGLIDRLSRRLEVEIERQKLGGVPEEAWIAAEQVKEKFGSLRFYLSRYPQDEGARARIRAAIEAAVGESDRTCESCGSPGQLRTVGWHRVLCDRCESDRDGR